MKQLSFLWILILIILIFFQEVTFANENCLNPPRKSVCPDSLVQNKVDWACKLLNSRGEQVALIEIRKMRYECCGEPNSIWVMNSELKMILEPIRPQLEVWDDLKTYKDTEGRFIFNEMGQAALKEPRGIWMKHRWPRVGEAESTPMKTWVKKCQWKDKKKVQNWLIGSGTWL